MNRVKLGDAVEILDSKRVPVSSKERASRKKLYPYYGAQGIVDYIDGYLFDGSYILVAEDGNNLKTLNEPIVTWATGKFWVNNHAHILGAKDGYDLRYVFYRLLASDLSGQITGSAQPKLNQENLANTSLEFPGLDEQKRVADLLSAIDAKIETSAKAIAELDSLARAVYDYWFVHRDTPDGWKSVKVYDLVEVDRGVSYAATDLFDDGLPMINLASFSTDASIKLPGTKHLSCTAQSSKLLAPADLVMCVTQQTPIDPTGELDVIAKTFLVPDVFENPPTFSMDVVRLKERRRGARFLVNQMMRRADYHRYSSGYANGTKIKHLEVEGALSFTVDLPPESDPLINRYADLSLAWHKQQSVLLGESVRLAALRDYLLPMLMNGQVTIDD